MTKDMKTYVNGELKGNVNLYDILESEHYSGTVDRDAGTATVGTVNINANLMNLKEDLRVLLNNGSASYIMILHLCIQTTSRLLLTM